jgi:hypothetical protein
LPDGHQIAFFADGKLKRTSVAGGSPVTVCDVPDGRGGAWAEDGTIVFVLVPDAGYGATLWRVSAAGGKAERLTSLVKGEWGHLWPQVLSGGNAVLYTAPGRPGAHNDANLVVQPLPSGTPKVVHRGGSHGRYLPSGHLVYLHDGVLFAVPFDVERLEATGQARSVVNGVSSNTETGAAQFAVSPDGTLVYLPGTNLGNARPVYWIDRAGNTTPLRATHAHWFNIHFAPDGRRISMDVFAEATSDILIYDWDRDTTTALNRHPAGEFKAVDSRWPTHRLQLEPRQFTTEPLLATGGWNRRRGTPDREQERTVAHLVGSERQVSSVRGA